METWAKIGIGLFIVAVIIGISLAVYFSMESADTSGTAPASVPVVEVAPEVPTVGNKNVPVVEVVPEVSATGDEVPMSLEYRGDVPVDCQVSEWSNWLVDCERMRKSRTRTITRMPQYGGLQCPVLSEDQAVVSADNLCDKWKMYTSAYYSSVHAGGSALLTDHESCKILCDNDPACVAIGISPWLDGQYMCTKWYLDNFIQYVYPCVDNKCGYNTPVENVVYANIHKLGDMDIIDQKIQQEYEAKQAALQAELDAKRLADQREIERQQSNWAHIYNTFIFPTKMTTASALTKDSCKLLCENDISCAGMYWKPGAPALCGKITAPNVSELFINSNKYPTLNSEAYVNEYRAGNYYDKNFVSIDESIQNVPTQLQTTTQNMYSNLSGAFS